MLQNSTPEYTQNIETFNVLLLSFPIKVMQTKLNSIHYISLCMHFFQYPFNPQFFLSMVFQCCCHLVQHFCFWKVLPLLHLHKMFSNQNSCDNSCKTQLEGGKQGVLFRKTASLLHFHTPQDRLCVISQGLIDYLKIHAVMAEKYFKRYCRQP